MDSEAPGFLKSIGLASNCCDKQEDDDAGRPGVSEAPVLLEVLGWFVYVYLVDLWCSL